LLVSAPAGVLRLARAQIIARWAGAPPGWQRRSQQRAPRCGYPVPARACRSRRGGPLGRAAGPAHAKSMCPPRACWPRAWAGQRRQVNSAAMRS